MSALSNSRVTVADYLAYDASHPGKHEFWNGQIIAMAGASPNHNTLSAVVGAELTRAAIAKGCNPFSSDQRVVSPGTAYAYPDFTIACDPEYDGRQKPTTLLNPLLIVEVTSPSTQHLDRTKKLASYVQIPSLQAYWLFEQTERAVTLFERKGEFWSIRYVRGTDGVIESDLFDQTFNLGELYALLDLGPDSALETSDELSEVEDED